MKRFMMEELRRCYQIKDGRILFVCGAPMVGKTWMIENLCKEEHDTFIRISAMDYFNESAKTTICNQMNMESIEKVDTLIIEDVNTEEAIRVARRIALRIRMEEFLPDFKIVLEGSLVDKDILLKYFVDEEYVKIVHLFPMDFDEFQEALSRKYGCDQHNLMKLYLITGGMPECVSYFLETGDFTGTRSIQRNILGKLYKRISKKEREILRSAPVQLEQGGTSFTYRQIKHSAREREYGGALKALECHGIVYRIERYDYMSHSATKNYKLYVYDVGLMGALMDVSERLVMDEDRLFVICNELLVKMFVLQQFQTSYMVKDYMMRYWQKPRAKAKLPFVLLSRKYDEIIPIEIACGKRHSKSTKSFEAEYGAKQIYRFYEGNRYRDSKKSNHMVGRYCDIELHNVLNFFNRKQS